MVSVICCRTHVLLVLLVHMYSERDARTSKGLSYGLRRDILKSHNHRSQSAFDAHMVSRCALLASQSC